MPDTDELDKQFCTYCNCPVGLHDEYACQCEDTEGHPTDLTGDGEPYCDCERTHDELIKIEGWRKKQ